MSLHFVHPLLFLLFICRFSINCRERKKVWFSLTMMEKPKSSIEGDRSRFESSGNERAAIRFPEMAEMEKANQGRTSTGGATIQDSEALLAMRAGLHSSASSSSSGSDQNIFAICLSLSFDLSKNSRFSN